MSTTKPLAREARAPRNRTVSANAHLCRLIRGLLPNRSLGRGAATCGILVLGLLFAKGGMATADPTLEVRNLHVAFPAEHAISVRGQLRCSDLTPKNRLNPDSEVGVNVDFPQGEQGWSLLPDRFIGYYITHASRHLATPEYLHDGRYYRIPETKKRFYNSTYLRWSPILDRSLDESKDDGRWIDFNKTLSFQRHDSHYRVVIGWKLSYLGGVGESSGNRRFAHQYHWAVYGPFPWGTAPECKKPLVAKLYRPVFFTEQGAKGLQDN